MAVKHAHHKKKVLTEIMKLMDKVGGQKITSHSTPISGESSEPENTDDAPADHEPGGASMFEQGPEEDDAGDEENAPTSEELDAMEAKLKKHGRR